MRIYISCLLLICFLDIARSQDDTPINKEWKVVADPGPARPVWPATLPWKQLNNVQPTRLLYPYGPTTFLMTAYKQNNNDTSENVVVGDLLTGKPVGILRRLEMPQRVTQCTDRLALSGDGKLLAQYDFATRSVRVIDVKAVKVKRAFPHEGSNRILWFVKPQQLLVVRTDSGKEEAVVWDVETGKEVCRFAVGPNLEENAGMVSVSPGGRFLALPTNEDGKSNRIALYDLKNGKLAGEVFVGRHSRLPALMQAVAISPDGKELAAIASSPDPVNQGNLNPILVIWNLATGREKERVVIERGNRGQLIVQGTEPLQWFPDQKAFLVDQRMVVNRADGKLLDWVEGAGEHNAHFATKVLDDTRLLVANHFSKLEVKTVKR
jgi:WD40 repeat protein